MVPQLVELLHGTINIPLQACTNDCLNDDWVRLIADFENILPRYEAETGMRRLEVVDRLSHISFRREDERGQAVVIVLNLFQRALYVSVLDGCKDSSISHLLHLANLEQSLQYLSVP